MLLCNIHYYIGFLFHFDAVMWYNGYNVNMNNTSGTFCVPARITMLIRMTWKDITVSWQQQQNRIFKTKTKWVHHWDGFPVWPASRLFPSSLISVFWHRWPRYQWYGTEEVMTHMSEHQQAPSLRCPSESTWPSRLLITVRTAPHPRTGSSVYRLQSDANLAQHPSDNRWHLYAVGRALVTWMNETDS